MSWFLFSLICVLGWGLADLFYKRSNNAEDSYSYLKTAVWVGLVMGVVSIGIVVLGGTDFSLRDLPTCALRYAPASLSYIISMVIGYAGLRYLELSIASPIQNASGALAMVFMILFHIEQEFSALDYLGTSLIIAGVMVLAFFERREEFSGNKPAGKYHTGLLALLFPILYCVFDTIGTAADGIILDEESGLGLGELDVLVLYGLTFMLAGIVCWVVLLIKTRKAYNPFGRGQWPLAAAAVAEEFGQVFYVYAMAERPVFAAPLVASYCIVSCVLARIFMKEKISIEKKLCIVAVVIGIVVMGIAEGLAG